MISRIHNGRSRNVSSSNRDQVLAPQRRSVLGIQIIGDCGYEGL
jgi:hypothetical protein